MDNLERLNKCPLCKSGLFLNLKEITDHAISGKKFLLCKCSKCNLIFTNPRPEKESISQYYQSDDYISHKDKSNNITNILYKIVRKITIRQKLDWLNNNNIKKGSLLDIGCGTGYFLEAAAKDGWKTIGLEPDETARKIALEKHITIVSDIAELPVKKHYQCITMFHVLEHIHKLRKTGKKLYELLKRDGTLFIAVPNYNSFDSNYYDKYWAGLDVPRHLYHFTQETIHVFAKEHNFKIINTIPMKFDSYYVSLLSEQYKDKDSPLWKRYHKGITLGLKSNQWAKDNDNNYSSLLFILKKK